MTEVRLEAGSGTRGVPLGAVGEGQGGARSVCGAAGPPGCTAAWRFARGQGRLRAGTSPGRHSSEMDVLAEGHHRKRRRGWHRLLAVDSIELAATSRSVDAKTSSRTVILFRTWRCLCTDVRENPHGF